ncbi:MAG: hypothetical protein RIR95_820 [Pseudomonadota bacterium]|jgi:phosphatidylethanolamine/phosphatidyl-N-methylethanolamine N-methyltransferase
MTEALLFLRQLIADPKQISAIAPSSRFLARAMTETLHPKSGRVVEFGPGTGRLTEAILSRGVAPQDLTLFEMNPTFAAHLEQRFKGVNIHVTAAQNAPNLVARGANTVISGLPLLSMPQHIREMIIKAAFDILSPEGVFVQFTYGSSCPISPEQIKSLGLRVEIGPKVLLNLPPARVYRFYKK